MGLGKERAFTDFTSQQQRAAARRRWTAVVALSNRYRIDNKTLSNQERNRIKGCPA